MPASSFHRFLEKSNPSCFIFLRLGEWSFNWRTTLAFALEVVFENIEIIGISALSNLLFRSHAEVPHTRQQCVDGANVFFNRGRRKRFDEGALLGDAALFAVFRKQDFFLQLGGKVGLEIGNLFRPAARIAAGSLFELVALGRTAKATAVTLRIIRHRLPSMGQRAAVGR